MKPPLVSVILPDNLPVDAYSFIVADTRVDRGEAIVRFRFGSADYWTYLDGSTNSIMEDEP